MALRTSLPRQPSRSLSDGDVGRVRNDCENCCRSILVGKLSRVNDLPIHIQPKYRTGCSFVTEFGVQGDPLGQRNLQFSSPHSPEAAAVANRFGAHVSPRAKPCQMDAQAQMRAQACVRRQGCEPPSRPWRNPVIPGCHDLA